MRYYFVLRFNPNVLFPCLLLWLLFIGSFPFQAIAKKHSAKNAAPDFSRLAEQVIPAVVNIRASKTNTIHADEFHDFKKGQNGDKESPYEFYEHFFDDDYQETSPLSNLGSGFIIDNKGYIVTNHHVVKNANQIKVLLEDEREYNAELIGSDSNTDLALIKINTNKKLPFVILGDSDTVKVGQWVVAIGSPFGLTHTITTGIISATGRFIGSGPYDDFIQTDASINPGNSGGPLININGEVIGINSAVVSEGWGIGFSIPINSAKGIIDQLKANGEVIRGWIGVGIQDLNPDLADYFDIPDRKGILVIKVFPGDPADRAGLKNNDIILSINSKVLKDSHDLIRTVSDLKVGQEAFIEVLRKGKRRKLTVSIAQREKTNVAVKTATPAEKDAVSGIHVSDLNQGMLDRLNLGERTGVMVWKIESDSSADAAGLQVGDVILELNHFPIADVDAFSQGLESVETDNFMDFLIHRPQKGRMVIRIKK